MRRWMMLLPLLLALLVVIASVGPTTAQTVAPGGLMAGDLYLALGDSLTTGTEASANNDDKPGYPEYLRTRIGQVTTLDYRLLGVSGETTVSMLAAGGQLEQAKAAIAAATAAEQRIGLITLSIGGNDIVAVLRGGGQTVTQTLALMRTNIGTILDELQAASAAQAVPPRILLMNYYNPYPGQTITSNQFVQLPPGQEPIVTDREIPRFNAVLAEEAAQRCIPVVDAFSAVRGNEASFLFVDFARFEENPFLFEQYLDYHPREAGHIALSTTFFNSLDGLGCRSYLPLKLR